MIQAVDCCELPVNSAYATYQIAEDCNLMVMWYAIRHCLNKNRTPAATSIWFLWTIISLGPGLASCTIPNATDRSTVRSYVILFLTLTRDLWNCIIHVLTLISPSMELCHFLTLIHHLWNCAIYFVTLIHSL